jgi:tight adherence protein B
MRRALTIAILVLGLAGSAAPAQAGTDQVRLALSPSAQFPQRQYTLELPSPNLKPYDVQVTENGVPVIAHLTPIARNRVPLSIAVLLDTSNSMRGRPLSAAISAVKTLIADKPARSEVAVFGFAATPYLVHGWSSSADAFDASLGAVQPSSGTSIWDAVGMASQSVGERRGASRALVLLTDGDDTESAATVIDAANAARSEHARVFVVGLPGAEINRQNLQELVDQTGGDFVQVRSIDQLRRVYGDLAAELGSQYVLSYISQLRGTGRPVSVALSVAGLTAIQHYTIPPIVHVRREAPGGWWTTDQALAVIAGSVALTVLLATYMLLRPKRANYRRRLQGYVLDGGTPVDRLAELPTRPRRSGPRPGPSNVWARYAADVERAQFGHGPLRILLAGIAAGTAAMVAVGLAAGQPLVIPAGPVLGAIGAWVFVTRRASEWYRHFDSTLPDGLAVLASSLRAGHSLLQAVDHVADEADDRTAAEWREVVRQTRLGIPVEDAIDDLAHRVALRDLQWISLVARVQHQVGGNMAEMFDIVAETVRQRYRLRAQVHTLTAQGRMTRGILTVAPFALGGILMVVSPFYISSFLDSTVGRLMIVAACCMIGIGSLWLKKIVEIEV